MYTDLESDRCTSQSSHNTFVTAKACRSSGVGWSGPVRLRFVVVRFSRETENGVYDDGLTVGVEVAKFIDNDFIKMYVPH